MATTNIPHLDRASTAFGISAAITMAFNTVLTWVKEAYEPLNALMKVMMGHHWTTHGVLDVALFLALGILLMRTSIVTRISGNSLIMLVAGTALLSALGIAAWFVSF